LNRPNPARYAHAKIGGKRCEQIRIGDITIDAVIEREGAVAAAAGFLPGL
jgi:hypothetical protein